MLRYAVYFWGKSQPDAAFVYEGKARQWRRSQPDPDSLRIRDEAEGRWLPNRTKLVTEANALTEAPAA